MEKSAAYEIGFRLGMTKTAGSGDNQPGPHPGQPAQPFTHKMRNVALGAAVIAGGALGVKGIRSQNALAGSLARQSIVNQRASQGRAILGGLRSSDPAVRARAQGLAQRFRERNALPINPTGKQKIEALSGHYKAKAQNAANTVKKKYHEFRARGIADDLARDHGPDGSPTPPPGSKGKKILNKLKWGALGTGAAVGGSIAGASAASKANERQSDDQPGT